MATLEVVYLPSTPLASKRDSVTMGQTDGSGNIMVALGAYNPSPGVSSAVAANSQSALGIPVANFQSPSLQSGLDKLNSQLYWMNEVLLQILDTLNPAANFPDKSKEFATL